MDPKLKTTLAIVGMVVSSFFSYLSSRSDNKASYAAMQTSIKELQAASYAHALGDAKLEGRVDAIETAGNARRARAMAVLDGDSAHKMPAALQLLSELVDAGCEDGGHIDPAPVKLPEPPSFDQAVKQFKEK